MLPDPVSNPGPLTYESGALPIALRGPASTFGVEPLSGVDFLEWRFGVTLADSDLLLMNKVSGKKAWKFSYLPILASEWDLKGHSPS